MSLFSPLLTMICRMKSQIRPYMHQLLIKISLARLSRGNLSRGSYGLNIFQSKRETSGRIFLALFRFLHMLSFLFLSPKSIAVLLSCVYLHASLNLDILDSYCSLA